MSSSFVDERDLVTKGFLKPTQIQEGVPIKLKILEYKRMPGHKFADPETGVAHVFKLEILTAKLREVCGDENGKAEMVCNSKRLLKEINKKSVQLGDTILLTRTGDKFETQYTINKVDASTGEVETSIDEVPV